MFWFGRLFDPPPSSRGGAKWSCSVGSFKGNKKNETKRNQTEENKKNTTRPEDKSTASRWRNGPAKNRLGSDREIIKSSGKKNSKKNGIYQYFSIYEIDSDRIILGEKNKTKQQRLSNTVWSIRWGDNHPLAIYCTAKTFSLIFFFDVGFSFSRSLLFHFFFLNCVFSFSFPKIRICGLEPPRPARFVSPSPEKKRQLK